MEKFMALNFQRAAILDFYDVLWLPLLFGSSQTIAGARARHKNPKWLPMVNSLI